jgi:hypothetical protein
MQSDSSNNFLQILLGAGQFWKEYDYFITNY